MDRDAFWSMIESANKQASGDSQRQIRILRESLVELDPNEIIEFDTIMDEYRVAAYRNELWAAAYIINGGCSDDGFEYFRAWLIAQGKIIYERALRDPNTLAD